MSESECAGSGGSKPADSASVSSEVDEDEVDEDDADEDDAEDEGDSEDEDANEGGGVAAHVRGVHPCDGSARQRLLASRRDARGRRRSGVMVRIPFLSFTVGMRGLGDSIELYRFLSSQNSASIVQGLLTRLSKICYWRVRNAPLAERKCDVLASMLDYDAAVELCQHIRAMGGSFSTDQAFLRCYLAVIQFLRLNQFTLPQLAAERAAGELDLRLAHAERNYALLLKRANAQYHREAKQASTYEELVARGEWLSSEQVMDALRSSERSHRLLWAKIADAGAITPSQYRDLRMELVARAYILAKCDRPAAYQQLCFSDLDAATKRGRLSLVQVRHGKTSATYGPPVLPLPPAVFSLMVRHKTKLFDSGLLARALRRPVHAEGENLDFVFITAKRGGQPSVQGAAVGADLSRWFSKHANAPVTATRLACLQRSWAAGVLSKRELESLDRGRNHSSAVSRSHYLKQDSMNAAAESHRIVQSVLLNSKAVEARRASLRRRKRARDADSGDDGDGGRPWPAASAAAAAQRHLPPARERADGARWPPGRGAAGSWMLPQRARLVGKRAY